MRVTRSRRNKRILRENPMPYVTEQNLTDVVLDRWKNIPDPRLRQVMGSLIEHLHGFVRDIEPTEKEWAAAIDFLTPMTSENRMNSWRLSSHILPMRVRKSIATTSAR